MKLTYSSLLLSLSLFANVLFAQTEDWVTIKSDEFGYIADFPQEPEPSQTATQSAVGELYLNMYMYDASKSGIPDDNLIYMCSATEYPGEAFEKKTESELDGIFDGAINGAVTNVNGRLLSQETIELQGIEGRAVKISIYEGQAFLYMRLFLRGNNLYILQVITTGENDGNSDIDAFFNSYRFLVVANKK